MGSFDCYCVLCSGPLSIGSVEFGSRKGKALRKRRLRVERYKRKLAGERLNVDDIGPVDSDEEMEDAPNYEAIEAARIEQQEQEEDDADSDYEDSVYDHSSAAASSEYAGSVDSRDLHTEWIPDCNIRPRTPGPEEEEEEEEEVYDSWSQEPDIEIYESWDPHEERDEKERLYNYHEEHTYDPAVVQIKDIKWLNRCRALAINPSNRKSYISGRGRYSDYGSFHIKQPGRDPNDTGEDELNCTMYNEEEHVSFPWHEACFEILAKSLGYEKGTEVDKDVLYWVFKTSMWDERGALDLKYELKSECGQFWECLPGEEYAVCDPSPNAAFEEELQSMLPASLLGQASSPTDLTHKVGNDPFSVLPYDILLDIFERIDTRDMLSLMKASHHINTTTRELAFWKHMLRIRVLPWFYELRSFIETAVTGAIDYKGLFLWIEHLTRPEFGNQGPLGGMAVANRRRIWNAVQSLVPLYKGRVAPPPSTSPSENSEEAQAIVDRAVCLHMPITMYPQPKESAPVSTLFIKSWNEISHSPCEVDTFWAKIDGPYFPVLVGVAVTFAGQQRVFGTTEGKPGSPVHIEAGLWIKQIFLLIDQVDMFYDDQGRVAVTGPRVARPKSDAGINGMQIVLSNGKEKCLKSPHRGFHRPMVVCEGMHFVGLTGEIAPNGAISRLGLLQAPRPDSIPTSSILPSYTSPQTMLWDTRNANFYDDDLNKHVHIWKHRTVQHHLFPPNTKPSESDPPADMIPNDIFLWANGPEYLGSVTPIECFQPVDARGGGRMMDDTTVKTDAPSETTTTTATTDASSAPETSPNNDLGMTESSSSVSAPEIVGIRPSAWNRLGGSGHTVGTGNPVPFQHPFWLTSNKPLRELQQELYKMYPSDIQGYGTAFNPRFTKSFPIDGKAGEKVTEVHVSEDYRALRLVTNTGRDVTFGQPSSSDLMWHARVAAADEVFLGFSVQFGALSGWSETMKMFSHMRLSGVGVVFVRVDEQEKARVNEMEIGSLG